MHAGHHPDTAALSQHHSAVQNGRTPRLHGEVFWAQRVALFLCDVDTTTTAPFRGQAPPHQGVQGFPRKVLVFNGLAEIPIPVVPQLVRVHQAAGLLERNAQVPCQCDGLHPVPHRQH